MIGNITVTITTEQIMAAAWFTIGAASMLVWFMWVQIKRSR